MTVPDLSAAESDALLAAMLSAPVGVLVSDGAGAAVACNERFAHMLGRDVAAMSGVSFRETVAPEDHALAASAGLDLVSGRENPPIELRYRTPDGRVVWATVSARLWHRREGEPRCLFIAQDVTDRKAAEERLRAAEEQFRVAFEQAPYPMAIVDRSRRFERVNRALTEALGFAEAELVGRPVAEFLLPDGQPLPGADCGTDIVRRMRRKDGTFVDAALRRSVVRGPDGERRYTIFQAADLSALLDAQRVLAESEARFRAALELAPMGVVLGQTSDGTLSWVNAETCAILGRPSEAVVGHNWFEFLHPDDVAESRSPRGPRRPWRRVERRLVRPDGTVRTVLQSGAQLPGGVSLGILEDVTDHLEAERRLRASEEFFRVAFDEAPLGMALMTEDQRFVRVNRVAQAAFGRTEAELKGLGWPDIVHPEHRDESLASIAASAPSGRYAGERAVLRPDGSVVWLRGSGARVTGPDGRPYVIGHFLDVTEERRRNADKRLADEALRRSQRLETVGRLAGGVAHDFNNMLAVILNFAELARMRATDAKVRDYVEQIRGAALRSAELTRRLMIFGRRDLARAEVVDLNRLVQDLRPLLQRSLGEDVVFDLDLDPALRAVHVAPSHMEHVLVNLVVNARDALPGSGRVVVRTRNVDVGDKDERGLAEGAWVSVEVEDTGAGMSPEVQALAFEPFFTTKEVGKGTGLGLAIVHQVIDAAGGHVSLRSAPGEGTVVGILLPAEGTRPAAAPPAPRPVPEGGRGEHVLVVEDEPSLRSLCVEVLREFGYRAHGAADAEEAIRHLAENQVDLVLSDVVMPGMSGVDLARHVRERYPHVPVLLVSGHAESRLPNAAPVGAAVLQKPFDTDQLLRVTRRSIDAARGGGA